MVELPGTDGDESEHANPEADAEDASLEGRRSGNGEPALLKSKADTAEAAQLELLGNTEDAE